MSKYNYSPQQYINALNQELEIRNEVYPRLIRDGKLKKKTAERRNIVIKSLITLIETGVNSNRSVTLDNMLKEVSRELSFREYKFPEFVTNSGGVKVRNSKIYLWREIKYILELKIEKMTSEQLTIFR